MLGTLSGLAAALSTFTAAASIQDICYCFFGQQPLQFYMASNYSHSLRCSGVCLSFFLHSLLALFLFFPLFPHFLSMFNIILSSAVNAAPAVSSILIIKLETNKISNQLLLEIMCLLHNKFPSFMCVNLEFILLMTALCHNP